MATMHIYYQREALLIEHYNIEIGVQLLENVRCFLSQCPDDDVLEGVTVDYDDEEEISIDFNWNLPPLLSNISFEEYGFQWLIELGDQYVFQDEGFEEFDLETGILSNRFLQALQRLFSCSFPEKDFVLHSEILKPMVSINNEEKQTRALLDNLFEEVRAFRYAKEVRALFDYCRRMQHLSPYNAALVYTQQPGTQLVLSAKQWEKERRQVKPNSRPLIILLPFGPVGFVYDISDTEPMYGKDSDSLWEQLLAKYINNPFALQHNDIFGFGKELDNLTYNLPFFGIKYEKMKAGNLLGANISLHCNSLVEVPIRNRNRAENLKYHSYFWLSVNDHAKAAEELVSLAHELGHLFCHHLYVNDNWWKLRRLNDNSREFEAESTAWLICSRLGFDSRSVEYLSGYKDDDQIPTVSFESIFRAANQVENMVKQRLSYKDGYLYKHDKDFKRLADEKAAAIKDKG